MSHEVRVVEIRDTRYPTWVRERCEYVGERRHGVCETFTVQGILMVRSHYRDGLLHGAYESHLFPRIAGEYRDGVRVGGWTFTRAEDDTIGATVDYDDRGHIITCRQTSRDGRERIAMPILHDDDIVRWMRLEDEWDDLRANIERIWKEVRPCRENTSNIQGLIDAWPPEERSRPLDWVARRIAAGEYAGRWEAGRNWFEALCETDDDPRFALIDGLDLDHESVNAEQLPRLLRRAPQMRSLNLVEADVEPSLGAMFAPSVDWSRLEQLHLDEVTREADLAAIAAAHLPALRTLTVYSAHGQDYLLRRAPWFAQLETFETDSETEE